MAAAKYKRTQRIALCALVSALCVALMSTSRLLPIGIYAIPAVCSVFTLVILIELGMKWAVGSFFISVVLSILLAEPETAMMYLALFGYYPILKVWLERIHNRILRWGTKLLFFNCTIICGYFILSLFVPVLRELQGTTKILLIVLVIAAELMFVMYDICLNKLAVLYCNKYQKIIRKLFHQ